MRPNKDELINQLAQHYKAILELIGEDPSREGLVKTPMRAAKAMAEITDGYTRDPEAVISQAVFNHSGSKIVIVKDIEFYSLCEHHILPFFGKISIGYIPDGKIIGLSKLARIVDVYAKRLQVQERLAFQICEKLSESFPNKGVIVTCKAQHLCMKMRGVEKQDSETFTLEYSGLFAENEDLRKEFFNLTKKA